MVLALSRYPFYIDYCHLTRFVLSTRSTGFYLTSLKLYAIFEIFPFEQSWPPEFELSELRNLEIDLTGSLSEHLAYKAMWPVCSIASWLTRLDSLETFKLVQDPHIRIGFDAISGLHEVEWPKLRQLHLENVQTRAMYLEWFIDERAASLRTLRIIQPMMPPKLWQGCLDSVQDIVATHNVKFESTPSFNPSIDDNARWYESFLSEFS